ncbi:MAG TPA: SRPBCC family protein [Leptolyngbyaceae cyanobacterium M65_K2018_010]|nr:SRPBCC family protein [Leptolyngbyaceae cyanobacterium M65_K2018_010]
MTEQTLNLVPSGSNSRQPEAGLTPEAGVRVNGLDEPSVTIQTEKLGGQRRRILAHTDLPFAAEQLWQILTDYDNLSSFIPNLSYSQRLGHPGGGIRLEQMGSQCFLQVKFCARVVLDMVEAFPQRISFSMVEGDFREFEGEWTLESLGEGQRPLTCLGYALLVRPPRGMPAGLIERHIRHDLTRNLKAIGDRAGVLFSG